MVIVNDRADIARLARRRRRARRPGRSAAGGGPRASSATSAIVGLSTHTDGADRRARSAEPVSYIAIGPVFGTATKDTGYEPVGLERVREAAALAGAARAAGRGDRRHHARPRRATVIDAGAGVVAVITDLLVGGDPEPRRGVAR